VIRGSEGQFVFAFDNLRKSAVRPCHHPTFCCDQTRPRIKCPIPRPKCRELFAVWPGFAPARPGFAPQSSSRSAVAASTVRKSLEAAVSLSVSAFDLEIDRDDPNRVIAPHRLKHGCDAVEADRLADHFAGFDGPADPTSQSGSARRALRLPRATTDDDEHYVYAIALRSIGRR
jgi:hypothetical protein